MGALAIPVPDPTSSSPDVLAVNATGLVVANTTLPTQEPTASPVGIQVVNAVGLAAAIITCFFLLSNVVSVFILKRMFTGRIMSMYNPSVRAVHKQNTRALPILHRFKPTI